MAQPHVRLSIVIVLYNSAHVIGAALRSLPEGPGVELVIVDNHSSDDSIATVEALRGDAIVIRNASNEGFAKAVNLGVRQTTGEHILLLNPDAVLTAHETDRLSSSLDASPEVGLVAPLVTDPDGRYSTIGAGRAPTIWRMWTHASGLSRLGKRVPILEGHYFFRDSLGSVPKDVDWLSGGCVLIRRSVWEELNGLTTRWFMYAEDIDFCLRASRAGWKLRLLPDIRALHLVGGSSQGESGSINPAWIVNLFDMYSREIATTRASEEVWRLVVRTGFEGRAAAYGLASLILRSRGDELRAQHRRFRRFSQALGSVDTGVAGNQRRRMPRHGSGRRWHRGG